MILFNLSVTTSFASVIAFPITSFTFPNTFETTSAIFPNTALMVAHNLLTAFRNVSEFLYKATNPATSPATAKTTHVIGLLNNAAVNALIPVVDAAVAAVSVPCAVACAPVAAVLAADAVADAASAAASAVVAAVFPASFVMTFPTTSRILLYVLTAVFIPCPNFPTAMDAGATAAVNRPTLMIVCCCPSFRFPNHSHNAPTFSENSSIIGVADVSIV